MKATREHVADFLTFLNRSVSPFHAVDQAKIRLGAQGFKEVSLPPPVIWGLFLDHYNTCHFGLFLAQGD